MANNQVIHFIKKLKPYNIQKGLRYLKHYGVKEFCVRLSERMEPEDVPYGPWYEQYRAKPEDLMKQKQHSFKHQPLISIVVPAYHTPDVFLRQMLDSLKGQSYQNWEVIIGNASPDDSRMRSILDEYAKNDARIKSVDIPDNLGISENTNAALKHASGDYIGFMDHDDLLAPDALFEIAIRLEANPDIDVFYTDEDKVSTDLSEHFQPHFKPDFNLDLLRSNNYICHFFVVKRTILKQVKGLDPKYNGAQDYDFIFRCTELSKNIVHIPRILYHWRVHNASTADNPASKLYAYEAGKKAIEDNLARSGEKGSVSMRSDYGFYNVDYALTDQPLVSILIPNKDHIDILKQCIRSLKEKATYTNYEIIVIENNSTEPATFEYYDKLKKDGIQVLYYPEFGFNYSAINNWGVKNCKGEYLLFLNNDIEVITPDFIEKMLSNCERPGIGAVGAKLYYPDNTIQHAGIIIGIGGIAGHAFLNLPRARSGYLHKASLQMNVSAVTAACMMVSRKIFDLVGGFEETLSVAFNDVDLCLRIQKAGYHNVYNPHVEMYHHESKSRGTEDSEAKARRFQTEIEFMRTNWIQLLKSGDSCYNPNLTLASWNYGLRADGKGVKPWTK
ncbi:Hyaluronan synthase [uncultured Dorea sp.]|uniref:glycosyltransferase family 2 protein n=1 Tax=Dorea formicigenerans TaxID=39486 RepID=UPI0008214045|nr:glycosyltransferase family 2 protein [uncultured Dorea sp.]SCH26710.1 Hyaluronan synthase [uncultured Dorea sp.]